MVMTVSLDTAHINTINISPLDFRNGNILAEIGLNPTCISLKNVPEVPSHTALQGYDQCQ